MSTNTTNMAMGKAVDGDNAKTYLETTLGAALDKIDAHDHSGTTHGISVITAGLAANAVTQLLGSVLSTDYSTSSTTASLVTSATQTLTTTGGPVLIFFSGCAHATTQAGQLQLGEDGTPIITIASLAAGGQANLPVSLIATRTPSAGSHTYNIVGKVTSGGTLTMNLSTVANGYFIVVELKR